MVVGIVRSTLENVAESMSGLIRLIGYEPTQPAFFAKPNMPDSGPQGQGLYTDPAVVDAFLALYPGKEVVIGEGCIVGRDAGLAFQHNGYGEVAEARDAQLVNLDDVPRFETEWLHGRLRLPVYLRTHEYVNVAKMKAHIQTGVTLGMKNQKGLLAPADKRRFHRVGLDQCIQALAEVAQPALTIVDGIIALESDGAWRFGRPVEMNVLVAGTDLLEVDTVCRNLMGFGPKHAPHIPPVSRVETAGLGVEQARRRFAFEYKGYFVYKNVYEHVNDSCSGWNWTLYRAFRAIKRSVWRKIKFQYRGVWRRLDIVMGHAVALPERHGKVVCLGDCAADFAQEHDLPVARGCPPRSTDLLRLV